MKRVWAGVSPANIKLLLILSAGLNVLLAATLSLAPRVPPAVPVQHHPLTPVASLPQPVKEMAAPPVLPQLWSDLRNGQFPSALARLRELQVPDEVVQDLLLGAAARRYGPKIVALRTTEDQFWRPIQRTKPADGGVERDRELEARSLENERDQLMKRLLGVDWSSYQSSITGRPDRFCGILSAISPPSRGAARQILAEYDLQERDVIGLAGGTVGLKERAELDRLYQEKLQRLAGVLSPSEIEEYELRTSRTADNLRQLDLIGFNPSEEEFRQIFRLRKTFDEQETHESEMDRSGLWQAQADLEDQLRSALGDSRYAEYRRSQDQTYRSLVELAADFDLPDNNAAEVYRLREETLKSLRSLSQAANIPEFTRLFSQRQVQQEAQAAARRSLGDAAFLRYSQSPDSEWLGDISQP